jgi:eukaryotic-like serine/threonine-protein kinase
MGEVYRALDTRVGRTVAVKILPADAAANPDRRHRFEREARAVARLNHPHICALYDVGRQDGVEFLVMEFLDGETLSARLARSALPLDEALKHGAALAQALARAHREGITHRDIKPSNVMLTDAGIKLLDFGLAKLRDRSDAPSPASPFDDEPTREPLSREGTLVGTVAYMSPEQLEGRPVDARTDIYALGLVIYEMITGRKAFARPSQTSLIAAILKEPPPSIASIQPSTPPAVERIVLTALAKDPDKRWQDASDLARELAWVATGSHTTTVDSPGHAARPGWRRWLLPAAIVIAAAGATIRFTSFRTPQSSIRSLVILPCRASGGDATAQAYCDGLTDTLSAKMTPLAVARGLQITSTMEVRGRGVHDAAQARREFGATLILDGGILRAGDTLRVNYVLVDAATLRQIEAYSATSAAGDPFALQDRVSTWAAGVLALNLTGPERQTLTASGTQTAGALELYLQGHGYLLDYQTPGNIDAAIDVFNRAIALDPRYALAFAGLGRAFWLKYDTTHDSIWVQQARTACTQAVSLDADAAASHVCLGTVALGTGAADDATREFRRAVTLEPMNDEATLGLARAEARTDPTAAENTYKEAIVLRPRYWATLTWLGNFYREHGRYADAARQYTAAIALTPDNARAYYVLCGLYGSIGRYDEAITACSTSASLVPSASAYMNWGNTLAALRRFGEAVEKFDEARRIGPESYRLVGNTARALYFTGRRQQALVLYARAITLVTQALTVNPRDVDARISLAAYYAKSGDRAKAIAELSTVSADIDDPHVLTFGAVVYMDLGDPETALAWLERAAAHGLAVSELHDWIELDALETNPRFRALLGR